MDRNTKMVVILLSPSDAERSVSVRLNGYYNCSRNGPVITKDAFSSFDESWHHSMGVNACGSPSGNGRTKQEQADAVRWKQSGLAAR